jgi:hypothetical protein
VHPFDHVRPARERGQIDLIANSCLRTAKPENGPMSRMMWTAGRRMPTSVDHEKF